MLNQLIDLLRRKFVRDTLALQIGDGVNLLVNVAVSVILARMLGPSGYGVYALILSLVGILTLTGDLGVMPATITQLAEALAAKDRASAAEYCGYFVKLSLITALGVSVIGLGAGPLISQALYGRAEIGFLAGLLLVDQLIGLPRNLIQAAWEASRRMTWCAALEVCRGIMRLGLIGLFLALGFGVRGVVAAELAGALILSAAAWPLFSHLSREPEAAFPSWAETWAQARAVSLKKHFTFGFKILLDRNVTRFLSSIPFVILGRYAATAEVGFLRLAFAAINVPLSLLNAVSRNLAARLPQLRARGDEAVFWRVYFQSALAGGVLSLAASGFFALLARWMVKIVYGAEYLPAVPYIYVMAAGAALSGFFAGVGPLYRTLRRMGVLLAANLSQLAIYLPACYLLIKAWESMGGALFIAGRTLAMNLIAFGLIFVYLKRPVKVARSDDQ